MGMMLVAALFVNQSSVSWYTTPTHPMQVGDIYLGWEIFDLNLRHVQVPHAPLRHPLPTSTDFIQGLFYVAPAHVPGAPAVDAAARGDQSGVGVSSKAHGGAAAAAAAVGTKQKARKKNGSAQGAATVFRGSGSGDDGAEGDDDEALETDQEDSDADAGGGDAMDVDAEGGEEIAEAAAVNTAAPADKRKWGKVGKRTV